MPSIFTLEGPSFGAPVMPAACPGVVGNQSVASINLALAPTGAMPCNTPGAYGFTQTDINQLTAAIAGPTSYTFQQYTGRGGDLSTFVAYKLHVKGGTAPFYIDAAIMKFYDPKSGRVVIMKNDPTWLQRGIDWALQNCTYLAIGAGAASGGTAAGAVSAACSIGAQAGVGSGGSGSGSGDSGGGGGGTDSGFQKKGLSTGVKVAIGAGAVGVLGTVAFFLSRLAR